MSFILFRKSLLSPCLPAGRSLFQREESSPLKKVNKEDFYKKFLNQFLHNQQLHIFYKKTRGWKNKKAPRRNEEPKEENRRIGFPTASHAATEPRQPPFERMSSAPLLRSRQVASGAMASGVRCITPSPQGQETHAAVAVELASNELVRYPPWSEPCPTVARDSKTSPAPDDLPNKIFPSPEWKIWKVVHRPPHPQRHFAKPQSIGATSAAAFQSMDNTPPPYGSNIAPRIACASQGKNLLPATPVKLSRSGPFRRGMPPASATCLPGITCVERPGSTF